MKTRLASIFGRVFREIQFDQSPVSSNIRCRCRDLTGARKSANSSQLARQCLSAAKIIYLQAASRPAGIDEHNESHQLLDNTKNLETV